METNLSKKELEVIYSGLCNLYCELLDVINDEDTTPSMLPHFEVEKNECKVLMNKVLRLMSVAK